MRSSSNLNSAIPQRGHKLAILAAVQSIVILWLASWAVGDYLNNQYVREYVDGTIQANQLMIFGVFALAIAGSIGGVWFKRRGRSSIELVNVKGSSKISTPVVSQKMGGSSGAASNPTPSPSASVSSASTVELHPAVAALKAEMSERRMSLGLNAGMPQGQGNAQPSQNTPSSVASMLPPDIRALAQAPKPALQAPSSPQQSPMLQTMQSPPAPPRPPMQSLQVVRPVQPNAPMLRQGPPDAPVPRQVQPTVPIARPTPPPTVIPQNVTTVITGIMPKKKDPNDPNDQKSSQ